MATRAVAGPQPGAVGAGLMVAASLAALAVLASSSLPSPTLRIALVWAAVIVAALGVARTASLVPPRAGPLLALLPAGLALLVAVVAVEALLRAYEVPASLIPTPTAVLERLWQVRFVLARDAGRTLLEAAVGYGAGAALGAGVALLVSRFAFLERGLLPYATVFSSVPIVALAPVIVKAVGLEWPSKAVVVAVTVFFPVLVNVVRGLAEVNPLAVDLMRSYAASERDVFGRLRVPNALPYLFNALKLGTTLALIGAIVAEFFGSDGRGLGFRILVETGTSNLDIVWAAVNVAATLGIAAYALVSALERRLTAWHVSFREEPA